MKNWLLSTVVLISVGKDQNVIVWRKADFTEKVTFTQVFDLVFMDFSMIGRRQNIEKSCMSFTHSANLVIVVIV